MEDDASPMTKEFFHGSSTNIDGVIKKGTCVTNQRYNALIFALRRRQTNCYLYVLQLDPAALESREDATGVIDCVLARDTPFAERILLTDDLIAEIRAQGVADGRKLLSDESQP